MISKSRIAFRLNVLRALLNNETQPLPLVNHVQRTGDKPARPCGLWATGLRKYLVRSLRGPPGQLAFLCAIDEVCLPRKCHLLGNIPSPEVGRIQSKGFQVFVCVAQQPSRFDARIKCSANARVEGGPVQTCGAYLLRGRRWTSPV